MATVVPIRTTRCCKITKNHHLLAKSNLITKLQMVKTGYKKIEYSELTCFFNKSVKALLLLSVRYTNQVPGQHLRFC